MTIDANLIMGFKYGWWIGAGIGVLAGILLTWVVRYEKGFYDGRQWERRERE